MNEDIRKATEELEALACDLERQVTAWDKDLPRVAAKLRALAAHLAAHDRSGGSHHSLSGTAAAWEKRGWHVTSQESGHEPSV